MLTEGSQPRHPMILPHMQGIRFSPSIGLIFVADVRWFDLVIKMKQLD
jgi:hypothetical protein